jgi:hypothetical protein
LRADMPQASQTARRHDGHLKLLYSHYIRTISAISCETCSAMIRQTAAFAAYQHHIRHTVVCRITTYARVSLRCFVAVSLLLIRCFLAVLAAVFSAVPSMVCGGFARFLQKNLRISKASQLQRAIFAVDPLYFQQTAGGRLTSRLHWLRVELRRRIGYIRRATSAEDAE